MRFDPCIQLNPIRWCRMNRRFRYLFCFLLAVSSSGACAPDGGNSGTAQEPDSLTRMARLERTLGVLAADSLEGRMTGTRGSAMAADFIAAEMERYGLAPAFGESYFQPVAMVRVRDSEGRSRLALEMGDLPDGMEVQEALTDVNVGGVLVGGDPHRAHEVVVMTAHFDHVGVRPPPAGSPAEAEGDSIYNGADDDATGVAAVLEVARSMARGDPPARTVLFLLITGEEMGILGTRWYLAHPVFPLEEVVANLNVEMLGRPGPEYGGRGVGWITGYERSTLGQMLTDAGLAVKPDPFPDRGLFFGSDNIGFAMEGIPAHTVSSSDLHEDYHTPDDEVDRIDFRSMTRVVETLLEAVRILADGEAPVWNEGGRPEPGGRR